MAQNIDSCEELVLKEIIIGGSDGAKGEKGEPGAVLTTLDADKVNVTNSGYTNAQEIFDDLLYVSPLINDFTTPELLFLNRLSTDASADFTILFNWALNKTATVLTFVGPSEMTTVTPAVTDTSVTVTMTDYNSNETFTLSFGDGKNTVVKNINLEFTNKVFFGDSVIGSSDGSFIESLTNSLLQTNNSIGIRGSTTDANEYFWFATPVAYGTPGMTVGGFAADLTLEATFSYTNSLGYAESYNLYRMTNDNLGSININITQ